MPSPIGASPTVAPAGEGPSPLTWPQACEGFIRYSASRVRCSEAWIQLHVAWFMVILMAYICHKRLSMEVAKAPDNVFRACLDWMTSAKDMEETPLKKAKGQFWKFACWLVAAHGIKCVHARKPVSQALADMRNAGVTKMNHCTTKVTPARLERIESRRVLAIPVIEIPMTTGARQVFISQIKLYLKDCKKRHLDPKTIADYQSQLVLFVEWVYETEGLQLRPENVDLALLEEYIDFLERTCLPGTIEHKAGVLRSFFRFLEKKRLLTFNPAADLAGPGKPKPDPEPLSVEQIDAIIAAQDANDYDERVTGIILEIMYGSGTRFNEARTIIRKEVKFLPPPQSSSVTVLGKGKKWREVLLSPQGAARLKLHMTAFPGGPEDSVFLQDGGAELFGIHTFYRKFWAMVKRAHVDARRPHQLRVSFVTHMLDNDAPEEVVRELIGHEDARAMKHYYKALMKRKRAVHQKYHPRNQVGK